MAMVFCRGCGKSIHETAPMCPGCGAPQNLPPAEMKRNTGVLVLFAFLWTFGIWLATLMCVGMVIGFMHPETAREAGRHAGEVLGGPLFLVALVASIVMTVRGILPGTRTRG